MPSLQLPKEQEGTGFAQEFTGAPIVGFTTDQDAPTRSVEEHYVTTATRCDVCVDKQVWGEIRHLRGPSTPHGRPMGPEADIGI